MKRRNQPGCRCCYVPPPCYSYLNFTMHRCSGAAPATWSGTVTGPGAWSTTFNQPTVRVALVPGAGTYNWTVTLDDGTTASGSLTIPAGCYNYYADVCSGKWTVRGVVPDCAAGLAGQTVTLRDHNGVEMTTAVTDGTGAFEVCTTFPDHMAITAAVEAPPARFVAQSESFPFTPSIAPCHQMLPGPIGGPPMVPGPAYVCCTEMGCGPSGDGIVYPFKRTLFTTDPATGHLITLVWWDVPPPGLPGAAEFRGWYGTDTYTLAGWSCPYVPPCGSNTYQVYYFLACQYLRSFFDGTQVFSGWFGARAQPITANPAMCGVGAAGFILLPDNMSGTTGQITCSSPPPGPVLTCNATSPMTNNACTPDAQGPSYLWTFTE